MNKTLAYAARHAREALRPRSAFSICSSCSAACNYSQRIRAHVLQSSPCHSFSPLIMSIRYLGTKRLKKTRVNLPKNGKPDFPLLEGESTSPPSRSKEEILREEKYKNRKTRESKERVRIQAIEEKPKKNLSERVRKTDLRVIASNLARPEQAGVYAPNAPFQRRRKPKKEYVGRPKTKKQAKAIHISASSLLKNYSPDFSVEWPNGVPLPIPVPNERTPVVYPYFVRRTKSNNLPVYNVTKHGGSMQITQIRHVEGDPRELLLEIERSLQVPLDRLSFNPLTRRVVIKVGKLKDEVCEVLTRLGF